MFLHFLEGKIIFDIEIGQWGGGDEGIGWVRGGLIVTVGNSFVVAVLFAVSVLPTPPSGHPSCGEGILLPPLLSGEIPN